MDRKRKREIEYADIDECVLQWFKQCRDNTVSLGGQIIKEKAQMFAEALGHKEFKASNGWLEKFKKRYEIAFYKASGESASVSDNVCESWKKQLTTLLRDYEPHNIFNADETGLFFKCLPDRTLAFKNEKCHGGKSSKERITILLIANMTGTEKRKLFVIGKSAKPRCFKNIKSLPVIYAANTKAWMTAELFSEQLIKLDKDMGKQNRKILLFIDNCSAHDIPPLKYVTVKFLPANTTSKLQPLDQGIIKNFKTFYRKEIVREIIAGIEDGKKTSITMLHAVRMADKAWKNVSRETIVNCFKSCGFSKNSSEQTEEEFVDPFSISEEEWRVICKNLKISTDEISFELFAHFDDDVTVCGTPTDNDIIASVSQSTHDKNSDEEEEEEKEEGAVSTKEAKVLINKLRTFFESSSEVEDGVFSALVKIENAVDFQVYQKKTQKKITDFF